MFVRLQRRRYHARPSSVPLARNNEQQPNGKRERERERQKKYENSYLFFFLKEKKDNQPTSTATNFRRRRRRKDGAAQKPPTHPLPGGWVGGVWLSWQPPPTPSPSSARHHVADTWWSPPTDLSPCRCRLVAQRGPLFTDLWNNRYYSFVFLFTVHTHTHTHTHTRSNNATPLKEKEIYNFKVVLLGLGHSTALLYFLLRFRNGRCPFRSTRDAEPKFRKKKPQKLGQCGRFPRISDSNSKKNKTTKPVGFFFTSFLSSSSSSSSSSFFFSASTWPTTEGSSSRCGPDRAGSTFDRRTQAGPRSARDATRRRPRNAPCTPAKKSKKFQ